MLTLGLILAVSWDALWSGPAKSAQVIGWPEFLVWISFLLVGVFVSVLAIASLSFALRAQRSIKESRMSTWLSLWVQYSVIGYFGLLAVLRYTLNINIYWWQVLIMAALLIAIMMSLSIVKATNNQVSRIAD
jgi:cell division protein FtsW (lipid II flippase)